MESQQPPSSEFPDVEFRRIVEEELSRESRRAHPGTLKRTIGLRVLRRVANEMGLTWSDVDETRHRVYVHPECRAYADEIWAGQRSRGVTDDQSAAALDQFRTRDDHRPSDLARFVTALSRREAKLQGGGGEPSSDIDLLVAHDGLRGEEARRYSDNLRHGLSSCDGGGPEAVHVAAVRNTHSVALAEGFVPTRRHVVAAVRSVLATAGVAFGQDDSSSSSSPQLREVYATSVGGCLDAIVALKTAEIGDKRTTRRKRARDDAPPPPAAAKKQKDAPVAKKTTTTTLVPAKKGAAARRASTAKKDDATPKDETVKKDEAATTGDAAKASPQRDSDSAASSDSDSSSE